MDRWERLDTGRPERSGSGLGMAGAGRMGPGGRTTRPVSLPAEVAADIRKAADTATAHHREVLVGKMTDAVAAYERNRFEETLRLAKQVAAEAPQVPAVRELAGLAAYRSQRWLEAVRHLGAYEELTEDTDVLPVLMDAQRALGKHRRVATLWTELRHRSPSADVLAEARIVAAGSLADRGDLQGAVDLLVGAGAARSLRNPADRHLRQWYALADLYERAGDLPRARELFLRVARTDPEAYDLRDRLASLGPERAGGPRRPPRGRARPSGRPAGGKAEPPPPRPGRSASGASNPRPRPGSGRPGER